MPKVDVAKGMHNSSEPDETEEGEKICVKDYLDELHSVMVVVTVQ